MPSSAMLKLRPRYGFRLPKGWLLPAGANVAVTPPMEPLAVFAAAKKLFAWPAMMLPAGSSVEALAVVTGTFTMAAWVWDGMLVVSNVTFSVPLASPWLMGESPGPWPIPIGERPLKSGNPKVVCPLPPYVVPRRAKSAVFWEIEINWPWHNAHPFGGKLKPNIMIDPIKTSMWF